MCNSQPCRQCRVIIIYFTRILDITTSTSNSTPQLQLLTSHPTIKNQIIPSDSNERKTTPKSATQSLPLPLRLDSSIVDKTRRDSIVRTSIGEFLSQQIVQTGQYTDHYSEEEHISHPPLPKCLPSKLALRQTWASSSSLLRLPPWSPQLRP